MRAFYARFCIVNNRPNLCTCKEYYCFAKKSGYFIYYRHFILKIVNDPRP
jgi:hypothetical protein